MKAISPQKHIPFERQGDKLEVIIRNSDFVKIYKKEVGIGDKKGLLNLLHDLRDKGIDLFSLMNKEDSNDWFI